MRDMFLTFSDDARDVMALSREEARRLSDDRVDTEHLLLGLLRKQEGVPAKILNSFGVNLAAVRSALESDQGRRDPAAAGDGELTARAQHVLELAAMRRAALATTWSAPSTCCWLSLGRARGAPLQSWKAWASPWRLCATRSSGP